MNLYLICIAPTQSPQNAGSTVIYTYVVIFWYPPTPFHQNGIIRNYTITYIATSVSVSVPVEITVLIHSSATFPLVRQSHLWINHLKPYTNYTFSIYAVNDAGSSPGIIFFGRTYTAGIVLINRKLEKTQFFIFIRKGASSFNAHQLIMAFSLSSRTIPSECDCLRLQCYCYTDILVSSSLHLSERYHNEL